MKTLRLLPLAALATASFFSFGGVRPTAASTFDAVDVDQGRFVAVAAPFGSNRYQLLIIEQVSDQQDCWSENGSEPVTIEPLLMNFDFTGICSRSTDSNGYSIRMADEDMGLQYILRLVQRNGELKLIGSHRTNRKAPEIEIGSTQGLADGFHKIILNPEWAFARRAYNGKNLGHVYLSSQETAPAPVANTSQPLLPSRSEPLPPLPTAPASDRELIFTPQPNTPPADLEPIPEIAPQPLPEVPVFVLPAN
ncbi:MAG: DUF3747 domain-containing protein [Kastovskya adunca ATA6-11-RM4]|nr:DUF3747 domain-containing protein [Kastovskya adunca ATA6-11-RM4]